MEVCLRLGGNYARSDRTFARWKDRKADIMLQRIDQSSHDPILVHPDSISTAQFFSGASLLLVGGSLRFDTYPNPA